MLKDIEKQFKMNMNSDKTVKQLESLIEKSEGSISLNLISSQYELYNQLTKGLHKKMEEYNYYKQP